MEDTLRVVKKRCNNLFFKKVLILVLMEDTLRVISTFPNSPKKLVLILVLMEDTLRGPKNLLRLRISLNPCFNGRYSQRIISLLCGYILGCLNPCFNGRYSQRRIMFVFHLV